MMNTFTNYVLISLSWTLKIVMLISLITFVISYRKQRTMSKRHVHYEKTKNETDISFIALKKSAMALLFADTAMMDGVNELIVLRIILTTMAIILVIDGLMEIRKIKPRKMLKNF